MPASCFLALALGLAGAVEQTHIALTATPGEMLATFVVLAADAGPGDSAVEFGTQQGGPYDHRVEATNHTYGDGGFAGTIYEATMTGLVDGQTYYYVALAASSASAEFSFRYHPSAESIKFLSYGDMGVKNSHGTYTMCNADALTGEYDLLLNVGDTSYADDYKAGANAHIFDEHFRNIEGHAARVPFMTVPGNHESQYDFAGYLNRLRMPQSAPPSKPLSRFYYSFDYGPIHVLVYSSEHPFTPGTEQHDFIASDLAAASAPAARAQRPWIIMFSHRPLYCSDLVTWSGRCVKEATQYRASIETLMVAAGVDLHISGHNHQYERSYPVHGCSDAYKSGCNVTTSLHDAAAPVHIVNGAAGDVEGTDPTWKPDKAVPFRAVHDTGLHTGYARVAVNRTALSWQFVYSGSRAIPKTNSSDSADAGKVADSFVLTKSDTRADIQKHHLFL